MPTLPSDVVCSLGVMFDSALTMEPQITAICGSCGLHIHNIGKIVRYLTPRATELLVHAFITSRLDSCNALLHGLPDDQVRRLQLIQNTAARLITRTRKHEHITPVLRRLHWLPVREPIDYKILLLAFKGLHESWHLDIWQSCSGKTGHIRPSVQHLQINWWYLGLFSKLIWRQSLLLYCIQAVEQSAPPPAPL